MPQILINNGNYDNDPSASTIRAAFDATNANFTELYEAPTVTPGETRKAFSSKLSSPITLGSGMGPVISVTTPEAAALLDHQFTIYVRGITDVINTGIRIQYRINGGSWIEVDLYTYMIESAILIHITDVGVVASSTVTLELQASRTPFTGVVAITTIEAATLIIRQIEA